MNFLLSSHFTNITFLLLSIASLTISYFSFGMINSNSETVCSGSDALLLVFVLCSVFLCSCDKDPVPVFGSGFQSDFWRLARFDCWLLVTYSAGVSAGSLSSWVSSSLDIVCRPLLPTVIVCFSGDSVPVFGSRFDSFFPLRLCA